MEEENHSTEYWCHECIRSVETITDSETVKCSLCHSGFIEEIDTSRTVNHNHHHENSSILILGPVFLRMMSNSPIRRWRFRQIESNGPNMRQRRKRLLRLLQNIRAGIVNNNNNNNNNNEPVILINSFNQTIIGSLGDYLVGSRLELFLQCLAENDPNRYGSPPAKKEIIEEMSVVKIETNFLIRCSVCLEDFLVGNEVKETPCKHKFHGDCIKPWLDLHSSCPVCRYRLPCNESNGESSRAITVNSVSPVRWGFNSLFSTSGIQITNQSLVINPLEPSDLGSGSRFQEEDV